MPIERIRGSRLQRIRDQQQRENPLCHGPDSLCEKNGTIRLGEISDHIEPLYKDGAESIENRQWLCAECNRIKTDKDIGRKSRETFGADGWPTGGWK